MNSRKSIAVNTRFLIKNKLEGIGLFTYESLKRIVKSNPDIDFYFLFDRAFDAEFVFAENVKPVVLFPQARHAVLWYWWFEISVARWLKKNKPSLFLSTDGYACLNTTIPQVMVIHDLAFEHFKNNVNFSAQKYYEHFTTRYAHKVNRIATVSEFSKADIVARYGIAPEKIDVVYNGAKEVYQPVSDSVKQQVRQTFTSGKNYFIYVGSIHPRKNIGRLLQAFDKFKVKTGSDFKLVLVGRKAWDFKEVETIHAQMKNAADVVFTGHVTPDQLGPLVASAFAMVYVSLFEGFGIPIVEAMNCRVPVITSNVTSMPEAAGDAALLVDPYNVDDIAAGMEKLVSTVDLYNALIENGKQQIQKFSWDLTAQKLWACCKKVLDNH